MKNNNHPFEFFSLELFHGLLFSAVLARYTPKLYRIEVKYPFRKNWSVKSECQNVGKNLETRHILSQRIEFISAHHHTTKQASTDIRTWGHHILDEVYNFLSSYKGQLISKANCQALNSSKKQTNEFVCTSIRCIFVNFWKKLKTAKRHFEIIWTLPRL